MRPKEKVRKRRVVDSPAPSIKEVVGIPEHVFIAFHEIFNSIPKNWVKAKALVQIAKLWLNKQEVVQ